MKIETPIKSHVQGCINCQQPTEILPMDERIGVGFGYAALEKDGAPVWVENSHMEFDELMTIAEAEELALKEPDADWRIHLVAPLSDRHYQRQGAGQWVLYEMGKGFA